MDQCLNAWSRVVLRFLILGGTAATGGGAQVGVTGQAHPACRAGGGARYLIT